MRWAARGIAVVLGAAVLTLHAIEGAAFEPGPPVDPADLRQVQIQAWISETSEQGLRELGVNLDYTRFVRGREQSGSLQQIRTQVFDPFHPNFRVTLPAPDPTLFNPPLRPDLVGDLSGGVQTQAGVGLTATVIDTGRGTIEAIFRAIEQKSDVDIISKPELLVINNREAEILAGGKFPFQDIQYDKGQARLNVQFKPIGVNMKMTPSIQADNSILLSITQLDVTDIARIDNLRGVDLPVFSIRSQTGEVVVPDGQTLVIGGLTSKVVRSTERRVPLIGKLPIVGFPFRGTHTEAVNGLLLVFVRPTVVDLREMTPRAYNALNFWQERRWQNKTRIGQEIQAMEDEL
jgi:type II secretory pathway component GspD/PulD (secretin)